jgi:hypothetical protein
MLLYRPTGLAELRLVAAAQWRAWPPRLPEQPIFYPVLTFEYARKIARDWNTEDEHSGFIGFVTRFRLEPSFASRYPIQRAGGRLHEELWVPAADLAELNTHLRGFIELVETFAGSRFAGQLDPWTHLPADMRPPDPSSVPWGLSCPCCRFLTLRERRCFEICPVCFWEDDGQDDPDADVIRGGPNRSLSLTRARANFASFGACDEIDKHLVRAPLPHEL